LKKASSHRKVMIFLGAILFISIPASPSFEDHFSVTGYYKNFSIFLRFPPYKFLGKASREPDKGAVNNRLRLTMDLQPWDGLSFRVAYDISARIQDPQLFEDDTFFSMLKLPEYRWGDLSDRLYPKKGDSISSFGLFQNLDRFYITLRTDLADVFAGRQPIAWGSARFINPTDVIAPFAFNELDKEERPGVDAIRIRVPLGMMDELDLGFIVGKKFKSDNNAFFFRGKVYQFHTDISAIVMAFRKHLLIGLDLARAIGGAGFWLESAYVRPHCFRDNRAQEEEDYFRASVGLDYNLNSKTYGFVEYHFSSAGKNNPERYLELLGTSAFREGAVYLFGKHYLNMGCIYQITPLTPFTGTIILNLSDGSLILSPSFEYNIAENIYVAAGAYVGLGKNPQLAIEMNTTPYVYESEFGAYPDIIFTSFRIYF